MTGKGEIPGPSECRSGYVWSTVLLSGNSSQNRAKSTDKLYSFLKVKIRLVEGDWLNSVNLYWYKTNRMNGNNVMKLVIVKIYSGANIYTDHAAIMIDLEYENEMMQHDASTIYGHIEKASELLAVLDKTSHGKSILNTDSSAVTFLHLYMYVFLVLTSKFNVMPVWRVLSENKNSARVIVEDTSNGANISIILNVAYNFINHLLNNNIPVPGEANISELLIDTIKNSGYSYPDQTTAGMLEAARNRNIPSYRIRNDIPLYQLGQGVNKKLVFESVNSDTSVFSTRFSSNKKATCDLLQVLNIPSPRNVITQTREEAIRVSNSFQGGIVIKPLDGKKGLGVSLNVCGETEISKAFMLANKYSRYVLVEQFLPGEDHRLTIINGSLVAAAKRIPATVLGDGIHNIRQLVAQENQNPDRGTDFGSLLEKIVVDQELLDNLKKINMSLESIPGAGESVRLCGIANIARGGTAIDVSGIVHADNRAVVEKAARLIDLNVAGVDFICPDITRSYKEVGGGICEINASPDFRMHLLGNPEQNVCSKIMSTMFSDDGRIRTAAITGTSGKTSVVNMLAGILEAAGISTGKANSNGVYVGGHQWRKGSVTDGSAVRQLFIDPDTEAVVFEVTESEVLNVGLAYDFCDVAAVTNISGKHLSIAGIDNVEQLVEVNAVVAKSSRGTVVINMDDENCLTLMRQLPDKKFALVTRWDISEIEKYINDDDVVCYISRNKDTITLADSGKVIADFRFDSSPLDNGGGAEQKIQNAQFALTLAYLLGLSQESIQLGIECVSFDM